MSLTPGTKLGQYEVVEAIGAGGMGEVYRARDTKLGRDVAIKVLPKEFARDKERLDRFEREARLLAQLNHANVATLYGLEEHDGQKFLVMELVEGETLAERIAKGPVPVDEAIPLFIQIAEGLEAAHEKAIIHRDLKPANIKIGPDGKPKILDFGLAKAFQDESRANVAASQSPTLTKGTALGAIMGTASYMSPEQARGKRVDKRTDIWAFGSCFYEALAGKKAFDGDSVTDVLAEVVKSEPDWGKVPRHLPRTAWELVRRCLRKEVNKRLQHIGDARVALQDAEEGGDASDFPFHTHEVKKRFAGPLPWVALVLGTMVLLALPSWWIIQMPTSGSKLRYLDIALAPGESLKDGAVPVLSMSRDGSRLVYDVGAGNTPGRGGSPLMLRAFDQPAAAPIPGTEGGSCPALSPDGEWLAFFQGNVLKRVRLDGGPPTSIVETASGCSAGWTEDGHIVFLDHPTSDFFKIPASGGVPEILASPDRDDGETWLRWQDLLPGDRGMLYTSGRSDLESMNVGVLDLESGERRILVEDGSSPKYVPTGHILFASSESLLAVPFDVNRLELTGDPLRVIDDVWVSYYGAAQYALSVEGTLVYAPASGVNPSRLVRVTRNGMASPLLADERRLGVRSLSPDGNDLVLRVDADIWVYDLNDDTLTRLTFDHLSNYNTVWSPTSDQLAFTSEKLRELDPALCLETGGIAPDGVRKGVAGGAGRRNKQPLGQ